MARKARRVTAEDFVNTLASRDLSPDVNGIDTEEYLRRKADLDQERQQFIIKYPNFMEVRRASESQLDSIVQVRNHDALGRLTCI